MAEDAIRDAAVVVHEDDVPLERWDDPTRGGVVWRTLFSGDRTPTSALTVGIAELPAGEQDPGPAHRHEPPEVYVILAGEGIVEIDGVGTPGRTGSAVFIPGLAAHRLVNTGATPLRLLYTFAVDSFADVTYLFPEPAPPEGRDPR
jgi:mannose-6-phosphate isomerase-like protein (cupin superfamily)